MKLAEATELWLLERTTSVVSVGSSSTSPRVASVTSSAPPSRNSCFSSRAEAAVSSSSVLPASRVASRIWRPYTSTVPAVWLGRPGAWKCAPKCSFATPFGGTVKYILAVLQAPSSPAKLPYNGS